MKIATKVALDGEKYRILEAAIPDLLERAGHRFNLNEVVSEEKALEIEKWVKELSITAPHIFWDPQAVRNLVP